MRFNALRKLLWPTQLSNINKYIYIYVDISIFDLITSFITLFHNLHTLYKHVKVGLFFFFLSLSNIRYSSKRAVRLESFLAQSRENSELRKVGMLGKKITWSWLDLLRLFFPTHLVPTIFSFCFSNTSFCCWRSILSFFQQTLPTVL